LAERIKKSNYETDQRNGMENIMKRLALASTAAALFTFAACTLAGAQAQAPSLGDYARSVRKTKPEATKNAKVYDNDNLPSAPTISVVGSSSETASEARKDDPNGATADKNANDKMAASDTKTQANAEEKQKASADIKPGQSPEDREKAYGVWKQRIDEQKKKIDQLSRDLDDFQHNTAMPQVSSWPDNQKYAQGVADRQKALDQAKAQLNDLQEQARKAGVPSSVAE
jgi:hypothetical protein